MTFSNRTMALLKTPVVSFPGHCLSLKLSLNPEETDEFILEEMDLRILLEDHEYVGFRILKPDGFQNNIVYHRADQGVDALLSALLETITDAGHEPSGKEVP